MQPERLGPYRIVKQLGRGGMGAVYEGVNDESQEHAALKILSASLAKEGDFRQRFEGEIETLKMLRHPNIVRLFGFGEQEELLYYAMELVDGPSLEQELRAGRRFDWREVARIGIETCKALRHAHDRGVTHRDIKPANLLTTAAGQVKLSDFGIARLFGDTGLTTAGNVVGTVEFMAPEQAAAKPVGPRSDLYSLGGVMYALLAGRSPFRAKSLVEILEKLRTSTPDPVSRYAYEVPAELEQIIHELLEKEPEGRPPNATVVGRRLEAMVHALSRVVEKEKPEPPKPTKAPDIAVTAQQPGATELPHTRASSGVFADGLAPTFVLPVTQHPSATVVQPSSAGEPSSPAADLPETRATSAFQGYASSPVVEPKPPPKPAVESKPPKPVVEIPLATVEPPRPDRFVTVAEEELGRTDEDEERESSHLLGPQTAVLTVSLTILAWGAWYMLRPLTADRLYDRISAATAEHTRESYRESEPDVRQFLTRFADDPRAKQLRQMAEEIELDRLETRFELRSKGLVVQEELPPMERAYLEAISLARIQPDRGADKLQALVDLYSSGNNEKGRAAQCLDLARRRLTKLREQLRQSTPEQLKLIGERLDHADAIAQTAPPAAQAIRKAVIELYADRPWAAAAVKRAQESGEPKAESGKPE